MSKTNNQAAIVGIGQTEFSKDSGRSEQQLAAEAVIAACKDAGINPEEIDGCITYTIDNSDEVDLLRSVGCKEINYTVRLPQGGAANAATLYHAKNAVEAGVCDVVVIWRAMNERSQYRFGQPTVSISPDANGSTFIEWCFPFGAQTPATWEALSCGMYLDQYGVTSEDLGNLAVLMRKHAATNPNAWFYKQPITLDDHQNSRWIVKPWLRLLDCCQESDGGVAIIVTRMDKAKDLKQTPARLLSAQYSFLFNHEIISDFY